MLMVKTCHTRGLLVANHSITYKYSFLAEVVNFNLHDPSGLVSEWYQYDLTETQPGSIVNEFLFMPKRVHMRGHYKGLSLHHILSMLCSAWSCMVMEVW